MPAIALWAASHWGYLKLREPGMDDVEVRAAAGVWERRAPTRARRATAPGRQEAVS